MVPLDVLKNTYTFDIAGETDYRIEQRPVLWDIGLQYNTEFFDINGAAVLTLPFVMFHKETIVIVNLKVYQCIESDVTEAGMVYEPSVFVLKAILDIFCISNGPLTYLDEFALTFGIKSREG